MKCAKCGSGITMDAGVVITCFYCGASIAFRVPDEEVPDSMKGHGTPHSKKEIAKLHPQWKKWQRRRERILEMLQQGHERRFIATKLRCSITLVLLVSKENGFTSKQLRGPHGQYLGTTLVSGTSDSRPSRNKYYN